MRRRHPSGSVRPPRPEEIESGEQHRKSRTGRADRDAQGQAIPAGGNVGDDQQHQHEEHLPAWHPLHDGAERGRRDHSDGEQRAQHEHRRVCGRVGHGSCHRDDQAHAGDDLRLHPAFRRLTMAVQHCQPTERGIDARSRRPMTWSPSNGSPTDRATRTAPSISWRPISENQAALHFIVLEDIRRLTCPIRICAPSFDLKGRGRTRRHRAAGRRQLRHRQGARQDQRCRWPGADVHPDRDGLPARGRSLRQPPARSSPSRRQTRPFTPRC